MLGLAFLLLVWEARVAWGFLSPGGALRAPVLDATRHRLSQPRRAAGGAISRLATQQEGGRRNASSLNSEYERLMGVERDLATR